MKINLSAFSVVVLSGLSEICQNVEKDINSCNYNLLSSFISYHFVDMYYEQLEDLFQASQLFLEKIEELQNCSALTSPKIHNYCLQIQKSNFNSTNLYCQINDNLLVEKRESSEPDLLTLLKQLEEKANK